MKPSPWSCARSMVGSCEGCSRGTEVGRSSGSRMASWWSSTGRCPRWHVRSELQSALCARNECVPDARRMSLRIGIHEGAVEHRDGDTFGEGVNLAARLEALARPGSLYVSEPVVRQVRNLVMAPVVRLGRGALKNIRLPVAVYRIDPPVRRARSWAQRLRGWLPRLA